LVPTMANRILVIALALVPVFSFRHNRVGHDHSINHMNKLLDEKLGPVSDTDTSTTYFYDNAVVDHFDGNFVSPGASWSQRFYVDTKFWGGEGYPVFLMIGGEGPQSAPSSRLLMWSLAEEHSALMISLEHRYYGESQPVPDMSNENMQYLTSEQALEDIAHFVAFINSLQPDVSVSVTTPEITLSSSTAKSKWVAYGGSYPGSLTTWVKLKYPALFAGTVGSSAPVAAEYDFIEYAEVVGTALAYPTIGGSSQCEDIIREGVNSLMFLLNSTTPMGSNPDIPQSLMPCSTMDNDLDLSTYQSEVFGNFQGAVQYNLMASRPWVSDACTAAVSAVSEGGSSLDGLAAATALFYNESLPFEERCIASSFQDDYLAFLDDINFSEKGCNLTCTADRQWIWQSCNEFGYFQTAVSETDTSNPFAAFTALNIDTAGKAVCEGAFDIENYNGPVADARGPAANTHYGARNVQGVNITMPNGSMDPWHALSVINTTDTFYDEKQKTAKTISIVEIDGTAHCRDMYAPGTFESVGVPDTEAILWAHAKISENVAFYLD